MSLAHKDKKGTCSERFWKRVDKKHKRDCWNWTGDTYPDGYGRLWVEGKNVRVNRFSWELHFGTIGEGIQVLHECDNPLCVNPSHLFLGTYRDNIDDMVNKGRSLYGEKHSNVKLTEEQVIEILQWRKGHGETLRQIARRFGVSNSAVELIRSGTNWRHLYHLHSRFSNG